MTVIVLLAILYLFEGIPAKHSAAQHSNRFLLLFTYGTIEENSHFQLSEKFKAMKCIQKAKELRYVTVLTQGVYQGGGGTAISGRKRDRKSVV